MSMLFAKKLKKLRIEKELSQRELAERLYVTRTWVSRWESGSRLPNAEMIFRQRLKLMSGGKLLITQREGGGTSVKVIIPHSDR